MSTTPAVLRVFFSAPAGLRDELQMARGSLDVLSDETREDEGVEIQTFSPGSTPGGAPRPRRMIDEDIRRCDYFVLVLKDRWRDRAQPGDALAWSTPDPEADFEFAAECLLARDLPMRGILVMFAALDRARLASSDFQLQQIQLFRRHLGKLDDVEAAEFKDLTHLATTVRLRALEWVRSANRSAPDQEEIGLASDDTLAGSTEHPDLVREAVRLADAGRLAGAESCFALAVARGDDPGAFVAYGRFLRRIGRLDQAGDMLRKGVSALEHAMQSAASRAPAARALIAALEQLAQIHQLRGEFEQAEALCARTSTLSHQIGDDKGEAAAWSTMGSLAKARGDYVRAAALFRKSLQKERSLNRPTGMANQYCNLGLISRRMGDLTRAEQWLRKALEIDERAGRVEAVASGCGNIGLVLLAKGKLDLAEEMFTRALSLNEGLGRLEGLANDHANLGALALRQDRVDEAEKRHLTSLAIEQQLGRVEGVARSRYSLALVAACKGDLHGAKSSASTARSLFMHIGMAVDAEMCTELLDKLGREGSPAPRRRSGDRRPPENR